MINFLNRMKLLVFFKKLLFLKKLTKKFFEISKIYFFYFFKKPKLLNKIGFFVTEEYLLEHFSNVLNKLDISSYHIILADKFKNTRYEVFVDNLRARNRKVLFLKDCLHIYKYKVLISSMYLGGDTLKTEKFLTKIKIVLIHIIQKIGLNVFRNIGQLYFQKKLGDYNIKFMYGLDLSFKYADYNNVFDEFFCHGKLDADFYKKNHNGRISIMGYPRYDNYFKYEKNQKLKKNLIEKYSLDETKKTILWICTTSRHFSTIQTYEKYMETLTKKYNIILRPHPIEIDKKHKRFNQKVLDIVKSKKFINNVNSSQDMSELYIISDHIFCDYGGSIFSALYLNKNILLLNHQNAENDENIYKTTTLEVRNYLESINEKDCDKNFVKKVDDIISSSQNLDKVKKAKKYYFGDNMGITSNLVAFRLRKILDKNII